MGETVSGPLKDVAFEVKTEVGEGLKGQGVGGKRTSAFTV